MSDGIFLLDKPIGFSSNQALQKVKRLLGEKKAGHTGSLDPLATGLLPLCFGEATKFSSYLLNADKTYEVTAKLGVTTTTGDSEGEIIAANPTESIDLTKITAAIKQFTGSYEQVPPMYSALKHQGQPLYKLARQGKTIERKARLITIYKSELIDFSNGLIKLIVACSKGTYIRSLIEDIGNYLGCGAHITALRRTKTGGYVIDDAITIEILNNRLQSDSVERLLTHYLLPVAHCIPAYPSVILPESDLQALRQGKVLSAPENITESGIIKLFTINNQFAGIAEITENNNMTLKGRILIGRCLWHSDYR